MIANILARFDETIRITFGKTICHIIDKQIFRFGSNQVQWNYILQLLKVRGDL